MSVGVVIVAATLLYSAASASADDLVTVVGPTTKSLPGAETPTVRFPIEVTDAGNAGFDVQITDVTRAAMVVPPESLNAEVVGRSLELTVVDVDEFSAAGDYSVTVLLASSADRQSLTFTLTRPAATLTPGPVVEVELFTGLLSEFNDDELPALDVTVDRGAGLTVLSARQVERSTGAVIVSAQCASGPCPTAELVELKEPAVGDSVIPLEYRLEGFDLGTTVRTVEIRSPQLASPVTVTFEVTKRRSPFLIPLVVLLGLVVGYMVRKVMTGLVNWSRKRAAINELRSIINGLKNTYDDDDFEAKLAKITAKLNGKPSLADVEQHRAAVAALIDTANETLATLAGELEALRAAVAGDWILPEPVSASIRDLRQKIEEAGEHLDGRRTNEAKKSIDDCRQAETRASDDLQDWIGRYGHAADAVETSIADAENDSNVLSLRRALAEAIDSAELADEGDLRQYLQQAERLVRDYQRDVEPAIRIAVAGRADRGRRLAQRIAVSLTQGDPVTRLNAVGDDLGSLLRIPKPTPTTAGGEVMPEAAVETVGEAPQPREPGAAVSVALPVYRAGLIDRLRLAPSRVFSFTLGVLAELGRGLLIAAIVATAAYAVAAGNWIGDSSQIMALFGWAFGVDLTVQAATAVLGSSGATPPTFAPVTPTNTHGN